MCGHSNRAEKPRSGKQNSFGVRSPRTDPGTRKNALFAGHDEGAVNWACIAALVETCKLNGVDPETDFADVLTKLVNLWPAAHLDELLP
jgi:hypothetical protein